MQCATCQTEIADNALICFRCGAPTTGRRREPVEVVRRRPVRLWVALLALVALAVFVDQQLEPVSARVGTALLFAATVVALWWRPGPLRR